MVIQQHEPVTLETPEFILPTKVYLFADRYMKGSSPKMYNVGPAKAKFTRDYHQAGYWRSPWEPGAGTVMRPDMIKYWKNNHLIYKLSPVGGSGWEAIFDPISPLGDEYVNGNLTTKEIRDLIPWYT